MGVYAGTRTFMVLSLLTFAALGHPFSLDAQERESLGLQVTFDLDRETVQAGETLTLRVQATDEEGEVIDVPAHFFATPFDLAHADADGTLHTFRQGRVLVFALVGGETVQTEIEILPKAPRSIQLTPDVAEVLVGGYAVLEAIPLTEDLEPRHDVQVSFRSMDPEIADVDDGGVVEGKAPGSARIIAEAEGVSEEVRIPVVENRVAALEVEGPSEARTGDVVRFSVRARDGTGEALDSPPVRWNASGQHAGFDGDGAFVAERPGTYLISASAGQTVATRSIRIERREHPWRLEKVDHVGFGDIQAAELWVNDDHLYVSTLSDRMYTFDVSDPSAPVRVDSVVVDARVVNDVTTTPDGQIGIITREGASDRRNGIVFLDLSDPLHPEILSEYTETVTGGVHTVFIDEPYAYLTDNATGSMVVLDVSDPTTPFEVARWAIDEAETDPQAQMAMGQYLHDMHVKDGLAYLAYWRHGLVILDIGNGIEGGSPENPQLVSRFVYNMADYYPEEWLAGTHAVLRYGDYVFVGDEVFPPVYELDSPERVPALGRVHVVDVSDIEHPIKVAEYNVEGVGSHNMIVEDDILYMGYYEGGLRVVDVEGELRGDLKAQGREIGHLWTGSPDGFRPNLPMAWGAKLHREHILVTDVNSGLWVARLVPAERTIP